MSMRTEDTAEVLPFRRELTRLKREGSALLVVGETTSDAHRNLCRQMIERETATRRVLVDTGAERVLGVDRSVSDVNKPNDVHIRYHAETRSACAATPSAPSPASDSPTASAPADVRHVSSLPELGEQLSSAITDAQREIDEPGQLRVCADSILPLVVNAGEHQVFRLLHPVTASIRDARAMGHVHLPVARPDRLVNLYRPLFDATVELRHREGLVEQRWHLTESGLTSEWLSVTRP